MELSQAAGYFNKVPVDGWDGSAWVLGIERGNFLTYDRFVGPRVFGHKQRMLLVGGDGANVMPYEVIRTPDSTIYIVLSYNHDIKGSDAYSTTFLLQQAPYLGAVMENVTTPAPSGIGGTVTPTQIAQYHCDVERYTGTGSSEMDIVTYGIMTIVLPLAALSVIKPEHELLIDSRTYEIKEVNPMLHGTEVRALQRDLG